MLNKYYDVTKHYHSPFYCTGIHMYAIIIMNIHALAYTHNGVRAQLVNKTHFLKAYLILKTINQYSMCKKSNQLKYIPMYCTVHNESEANEHNRTYTTIIRQVIYRHIDD